MNEFGLVEPEASAEFQTPEAVEPEKGFPSFRYGPDGQSAVFNSAADAPKGWHEHPSDVPGAPDPSNLVAPPRRPDKAVIMKDLKRKGIPFNPMDAGSKLHALLQASEALEVVPDAPAKPKSPLGALRAEYKALTGKKPSPRLDANALSEKLAALKKG